MTLEAVPRPSANSRLAFRLPTGLVPVLIGFAPVVGLAGAQGGYFSSAWGWATFPLLWAAALALALRERIRLSRSERIFIGLLVALTLWTLLSATWSAASAPSILESQRALLYVAGVGAALLLSRSRNVSHLLGGLLGAICAISAFSLATRLLPDRVGVYEASSVYRLAQPIGYWNGLAVFAGMGALLALAFAGRARSLAARAACAGVLVLLLPTFYFTFGRGAWVALGAGLLTAIVVDPRRLHFLATLLVLAPLPAISVLASSREPGLTHAGVTLSRAVHDGHRLTLVLLFLGVANAVAALAFAFVERRVSPPAALRRGFAVAIALVVVLGVAVVFSRYGGPATIAQKGYDAFKAPPPHVEGNLKKRLLNFSGNGRADLWQLAWEDATKHPVLGAGAGTYERYFLAHQPSDVSRVRDAHGLYIETLAELGPVGLLLLLGALALPLTVLAAARTNPLVPAAAGAYAAYLVHTGADWDWELPAVTLTGLLCGTAILIAGRRSHRSPPLRAQARWIGVGLVILAAGSAAVGLVGNTALSRSDLARQSQDWERSARDARRANSWMPWSPKPWEALGRAQLGAGQLQEARQSFLRGISMDSGDWELWYRLASASRGEQRRDALRHAARLIPRAELLPAAGGKGANP
ncbi:MAG: O-antigen ligase family protein [Actinobacteria bacterium]|nr:O-antigen ligase family protein [Actinomycetota bacterium]